MKDVKKAKEMLRKIRERRMQEIEKIGNISDLSMGIVRNNYCGELYRRNEKKIKALENLPSVTPKKYNEDAFLKLADQVCEGITYVSSDEFNKQFSSDNLYLLNTSIQNRDLKNEVKDYKEIRKNTREICAFIDEWTDFYCDNIEYLYNDDGTERKPSDSPEDSAKIARALSKREELNEKFNLITNLEKFTDSTSIEEQRKILKETVIKPLEKIADKPKEEVEKFDFSLGVKCMTSFANKNPEEYGLIAQCRDVILKLEEQGSESYEKYVGNTEDISGSLNTDLIKDKGQKADEELKKITQDTDLDKFNSYSVEEQKNIVENYELYSLKQIAEKPKEEVRDADFSPQMKKLYSYISNNKTDSELIRECRNTISKLEEQGSESFKKYAETLSEGSQYVDFIKKEGTEADKIIENYNEFNKKVAEFNEENKKLLPNFRELKKASRHDSREYKELMKAVENYCKEHHEYDIKDEKNDAKVNQFIKNVPKCRAVALLNVKEKIEAYLEHKAKDGINRGSYGKIAAVEKLNKFVVNEAKKLNLDKFDYKDNDKQKTFDPNYFKTYKEELAEAKGNGYKVKDTSRGKRGLSQESKMGGKDLNTLCNASDCMDRIMLKAITMTKNNENVKPEKNKNYMQLYGFRESLIEDPIRSARQASVPQNNAIVINDLHRS